MKLDNFWGIGFNLDKVMNERTKLGFTIDYWFQPGLELGGLSFNNTLEGGGGRILGELNHSFNNKIPIGLYLQAGYKTDGFIEGERLGKGLIARLGLSLRTGQKLKEQAPKN